MNTITTLTAMAACALALTACGEGGDPVRTPPSASGSTSGLTLQQPLVQRVARGQDQHRLVTLLAVPLRQHIQAGLAIGKPINRKAQARQAYAQAIAYRGGVFDQQDAHDGHCP